MTRKEQADVSPRPEYNPTVGWIALPDFMCADEVTRVMTVCDELLRLPAADRNPGDKPVAGTRHLVELDNRSSFVDALLARHRLTDVVTDILGPSFRRDQVSYRSPQPGFGGQYLHADDVPKLAIGPDAVATAIVALVDFTETNGSTRVVPGSHRRLDLQRKAGALESHPDQIQLTGPAGTAFVFSGHILHSGTPNDSDFERPALQLVWRT